MVVTNRINWTLVVRMGIFQKEIKVKIQKKLEAATEKLLINRDTSFVVVGFFEKVYRKRRFVDFDPWPAKGPNLSGILILYWVASAVVLFLKIVVSYGVGCVFFEGINLKNLSFTSWLSESSTETPICVAVFAMPKPQVTPCCPTVTASMATPSQSGNAAVCQYVSIIAKGRSPCI